MSTYINTNTTAMMASFNLDNNTSSLNKDIEQLSTGLRINSAADDAAGLVVSENMAAQLSGLNQATSNTNDAINMTKTAEGALNQVQNLLISMRQLAVQASNLGANDSTDVQADQTQIASAIQSINTISTNTQYGTKYLLNGSSSSAMTTTNGSAVANSGAGFSVVAQGAWSSSDAGTYTNATLSAASATTVTYGTTSTGGGTPATLSAANANFGGAVSINGTSYQITSAPGTANLAAFNTSIASSGYQASISSNGNVVFTAADDGPTTAPTIDMSGLTVSGSVAATGAASGSGTQSVTFAAAAGGTGGTLPGNQADLSSSTAISVSGTLSLTSASGTEFSKTYAAGTSIKQVQADLNAAFGTGADKVTAGTDGNGDLSFTDASHDLTNSSSNFAAYNTTALPTNATTQAGTYSALTVTDGGGTSLTSASTQDVNGSYYYSFSNGLVLSSANAQPSTGTSAIAGSLTTTAGTTTTGTDLEFQIGANGGQTASLSIGSTAADELGKGAANYTDANGNSQTVETGSVADINVTTFKGAQDAISVLDKAISDISTDRANLGAFQSNVLESQVQSLGSATTNLSASESTVKDADLASTIVDYTKNQILVSSATSALSYANQEPQSILKLLQ